MGRNQPVGGGASLQQGRTLLDTRRRERNWNRFIVRVSLAKREREETRPVIIRALEMARTKKVERPWKKHGVMPV